METLLAKKIVMQAYRMLATSCVKRITIDDIYNEVNKKEYIMRRSEVKRILELMLEEYNTKRIA